MTGMRFCDFANWFPITEISTRKAVERQMIRTHSALELCACPGVKPGFLLAVLCLGRTRAVY